MLGPDGFVDSKSVQYQYMKKQEALRRQQEEQEYKPSTSNAARRKVVSAFQLSADNSREQKNYDSLLRALEVPSRKLTICISTYILMIIWGLHRQISYRVL